MTGGNAILKQIGSKKKQRRAQFGSVSLRFSFCHQASSRRERKWQQTKLRLTNHKMANGMEKALANVFEGRRWLSSLLCAFKMFVCYFLFPSICCLLHPLPCILSSCRRFHRLPSKFHIKLMAFLLVYFNYLVTKFVTASCELSFYLFRSFTLPIGIWILFVSNQWSFFSQTFR